MTDHVPCDKLKHSFKHQAEKRFRVDPRLQSFARALGRHTAEVDYRTELEKRKD